MTDPSCACGCGTSIPATTSRRKPQRYVAGHNSRRRSRAEIELGCAVVGCPRAVKTRGHCGTHYKRLLDHGDAGPATIRVRRYSSSCSVSECPRRARDNGMCPTHAKRVRVTGDAGAAALLHAVSYEGQVCAVDDCDRRPRSRGWCVPHYKRFLRYGDPLICRPRTPAVARFVRMVGPGPAPTERPGLGPCQLWSGGIGSHGYGTFSDDHGRHVLAHRWSYEHHIGPIPSGLVIDHLCRVRRCVNPDHLEVVTQEENLRRGAGYGLQNGMRRACIHDHEYTPANTYTARDGGIRCRTCSRLRDRNRQRKKVA